ncbi:MAG: LLM class flavin-dependent oxidoreductase [Pseudomonadota bacterium]
MTLPQFGLNRFDWRSPEHFATDVARAEALGWNWALIPASSMKIQDPYVNLSFAAARTDRIGLGVLLDNPVVRHPAVLASSIATVERMAPGRTLLTLGVGDTAVRLVGSRPARVATLEAATAQVRQLMTGEPVEVGAAHPARMEYPATAPVWIAAGGPRTLRMAGRVADGVFLRVGTHTANLRNAYAEVCAGAREAGRDPEDVRIGLIFHVVLEEDSAKAALIARSMAAGYYEYSPMLFDAPGFVWDGPPCEELKARVWPDFHHHPKLEESGALVAFLSDEIADAFAIYGSPDSVAQQLAGVLDQGIPCDILVPHPMPTPRFKGPRPDYMQRFSEEVLPRLRALHGEAG